MKKSIVGLALVYAIMQSIFTCSASADEFMGFGQPSPKGFSFQEYPVLSRGFGLNTSASSFTEFAYFTGTGFTGTDRDRHEFWTGVAAGYSHTLPGSTGANTGIQVPELAYQYYYNVIRPNAEPNSPNYETLWLSPFAIVTFPNGESKNSGYGAGGNQFSYNLGFKAYFQKGNFNFTFDPLQLSYSDRSFNNTVAPNGRISHLRGGFTFTLADTVVGYQVTPTIALGVHHGFSLYSAASSDFQEAREGKIGPAFAYAGLLKSFNLYIAGNLDFDYYTSRNYRSGTSFVATLIKAF